MSARTDASPADTYVGAIHWPRATDVMTAGGIVSEGHSSKDLLDAVGGAVALREQRWAPARQAAALGDSFAEAMTAGKVTLGTPALTNLWSPGRPLSSCVAVPIGRRSGDEHSATRAAAPYYLDNMGSGFNLDGFTDPVGTLLRLNGHAAEVDTSDRCERYVGNMAHLSVGHPALAEFIDLKTRRDLPHFNLSVNFSHDQLEALAHGDRTLHRTLDAIAESAWACGDPGLICLDRFNADNPLRDHSPYTTTAPCAEVGLAAGDTCLFAYLNLAAFAPAVDPSSYDTDGLRSVVALTVRVLDSLLDAGEQHLANPLSRSLVTGKRRIAIAVCGYADLLVWYGLDYGSAPAVVLLGDLLSLIAFEATSTSIDLAKQRGAFASFALSGWATGQQHRMAPTRLVGPRDWLRVHRRARSHGLRHSSHTALPPSGRSSILLGVNPSIEPFLTDPRSTALNPDLRQHAQAQPPTVVRSATEIGWRSHLDVVKAAAAQIDESVSKTVNLASAATVADVRDVYLEFMRSGLKAVSVYRPAA